MHRVLALPRQDRWDLARGWLLLLVVDLGLRLLPFRQVQGLLATNRTNGVSEAVSPDSIERLAQLVGIAARNQLYAVSCLRRSLVLQRMLSKRGIATELKLGVNREDTDALSAHAWLEYAGQPIGEPGTTANRFAPLATLEAGP